MTRADLKHCWKMPDVREELNRSMREGRIESRHSIKTIIIIIMVIFKCYFSGEHIALSTTTTKNHNGVNIELGKTNRLNAQCMMQINI